RMLADVHIEIFVPKGKILAQKTLNPRLGIIDGISILGTTGVVHPISNEAYIATIKSSLSVANATNLDTVVLTTGRRSEKIAQQFLSQLPQSAFIQIGDFFKASLDIASSFGFKTICIAAFFGKAIKMAQNVPHTHASKHSLSLCELSNWAKDLTHNDTFSQKIHASNTAREAFEIIEKEHPELIFYVGQRMLSSAKSFAKSYDNLRTIIFDYDGKIVFDSEKIS
ncbi:MAG: cobalt-precorrin-5B (C(1))-methyltransferase, partial [Desulfobacterales bacterium]|nr:cobalt-precorrin-5B (C(1))-methyltransferase [Desulfobacterales bacterium]